MTHGSRSWDSIRKVLHGPVRILGAMGLSFLIGAAVPAPGHATPLTLLTVVTGTDWDSAGVGGIGAAGSAQISLEGVSGTITGAFLFWHGIAYDPNLEGVYDNPTVVFNGNAVTGQSIGDSGTNSWGPGTSRAFRANVTDFVTGSGTYLLEGLANCANCNVNGASLVVTFNDGNLSNNRDLYIFGGNDANVAEGFPGETNGWHATFPGINYAGGPVVTELHVADGQQAADNSLTFATIAGSITFADSDLLYDGNNSVPSAGGSRLVALGGVGDLWDIHAFDISGAFGPTGLYTLSMHGQEPPGDSLGLIVLLLDTAAAPQQPVPEPGTMLLTLVGLLALASRRWRGSQVVGKRHWGQMRG